jgi:hypothetical protein
VDITSENITYSLRHGEGLRLRHYDEEIQLSEDEPVAVRPFGELREGISVP